MNDFKISFILNFILLSFTVVTNRPNLFYRMEIISRIAGVYPSFRKLQSVNDLSQWSDHLIPVPTT